MHRDLPERREPLVGRGGDECRKGTSRGSGDPFQGRRARRQNSGNSKGSSFFGGEFGGRVPRTSDGWRPRPDLSTTGFPEGYSTTGRRLNQSGAGGKEDLGLFDDKVPRPRPRSVVPTSRDKVMNDKTLWDHSQKRRDTESKNRNFSLLGEHLKKLLIAESNTILESRISFNTAK